MAILGIPTNNNESQKRFYQKRNFSNHDAVENLIHYITRTRVSEDRKGDLITYGAVGAFYYNSVEDVIQQFKYVQNVYGINNRNGRRMYHEVLNLLDFEAEWLGYAPEWFFQVGMECCQFYFQMGFQAVFAVHYEENKHYHFHCAVNSINFITGRKWHTSLKDIRWRENIFNEVLNKYQVLAGRKAAPFVILKNKQEIQQYCTKGKLPV